MLYVNTHARQVPKSWSCAAPWNPILVFSASVGCANYVDDEHPLVGVPITLIINESESASDCQALSSLGVAVSSIIDACGGLSSLQVLL